MLAGMKHIPGILLIVLLAVAGIRIYNSKPHVTGYSMLLWNMPEKNLQDGDIVPVYIKSNISHVYVVGHPDKSNKEKFEVPLWQVTEPQSLGKTKKQALRYQEYFHQYAHVALDGLPVRNEPVNTSKQVYRLRLNETVKLLYKGKGQPVMVGNRALEGDWLRILTQDGTTGWCFSNNLRQFSVDAEGKAVDTAGNEVVQAQEDTALRDMLSKKWYPDYYVDMIKSKLIDLSRMSVSYRFDTGAASGTVSLTLPDLQVSWPYGGVTKTGDGVYTYTGIPLSVTVRNPDFIVVRYTDTDGKPRDYNMVTIQENIGELVAAENTRRTQILASIRKNGSEFTSSNYGSLSLHDDNSFSWTGYRLLVPSLISRTAGSTGTVSIQYFISDSLKKQYDGMLTFVFDGMDKEVNFLYKIEDNGLRLEDASGARKTGRMVQSRGISPLVLFFAR